MKVVRLVFSMTSPEQFFFARDGWVPNHPSLPVKLYSAAVNSPASDFEPLFRKNGWPPQWQGGVFSYHHYHSTTHEVLGCAEGWARLMLGGPHGKEVRLQAGDAVLLPVGTGHCCLEASNDFLVVGAYPPGCNFDLCREEPTPSMLDRIARLDRYPSDPVTGSRLA